MTISIISFQNSHNFELINYSEHGTLVDNVLYSCDLSSKLAHTVESTNLLQSPTRPIPVKKAPKRKPAMLGKRRGKRKNKPGPKPKPKVAAGAPLATKPAFRRPLRIGERASRRLSEIKSEVVEKKPVVELPPEPRMCAQKPSVWKECQCSASASAIITGNGAGWEGAALLRHGSHIKIGCLEFVFSITTFGQSTISASAVLDETAGASTLSLAESASTLSAPLSPNRVIDMDLEDPR